MAQVDVIIPVYNTNISYVRQAISSVLAQTFDDWRAMIVNDGSQPEYSTQLEQLLKKLDDSRIHYIKSANQGLPAARNLGIGNSDSPYIAFLDSDDAWYPNKLERQLETMQTHSDIALVHACTDLLYGDDESGLHRVTPTEQNTNGLSQRDTCVKMFQRNFVSINTVMLRRTAGESVGMFDGGLRSLEDKDLWVRLLLAGHRFHHIPETLAIYRMHTSNMSKDAEKMRDGRMKLIHKIDSLLDQSPPWLHAEWPTLRRTMVRNTHREMAETYLESRRFTKALRYAMPWHSGISGQTAKMCAAACLGAISVRR